MFAESSPKLHLRELFFKNVSNGRGRSPPILSSKFRTMHSARLAQPLRGMFFMQTLAAYFLDGTRYFKRN